ncbi:4Fe-4S dicluster domain-containing protein [Pseudonocardia phyllosphaerae]|uniref:4Fe-4S dicluster domain-containing protein n=1 Tax=Pseudonocardia phyllosphaerae TaxID=3390502 RepID=UPI00397E0654
MGQLAGPTDPTADVHWDEPQPRKGFFTDTSICIGCKACEVACKEWNHNPRDGDLELTGMSYDNTEQLGASTWRHVAFIEQDEDRIEEARASGRALVNLGLPSIRTKEKEAVPAGVGASSNGSSNGALSNGSGNGFDGALGLAALPPREQMDLTPPDTPEFRWLMSSDVCKHCTHAGCLDVCPTGALFRTEFGTVVVQHDVCNGCGTCVAGCPFGVVERRADGTAAPTTGSGDRKGEQPDVPRRGVAQKCTLCYDRLIDGETPACAKTCPTTSIKFGDTEDLAVVAQQRVEQLHAQGLTEARLYGANPNDGVGGTGSIFLLLDEPEVYGLPPDPRVCTADLPEMWKTALIASAGMVGAAALAFLTGGRR